MEAVIITWSERKVLKRVSLPRKILSNGAFATIRSREAQQFGRWTTRGRGSENIHNFMFTKIKIKRLCSRWSAWIAPLGSAGNSVPWWSVPPGQGVDALAAATHSTCLWQQPIFKTYFNSFSQMEPVHSLGHVLPLGCPNALSTGPHWTKRSNWSTGKSNVRQVNGL